VVLRALKDLAARLTALERRLATSPATSSLPHSQLPNTAKKSNFPPPTTTTNYRLPKTDGDRSEKGKERLEREEIRELGNPKRPSANATSTSSHPAGGAKPNRDATATPPAQTEDHPQRVGCTLWVPDSLVGQIGRGLKLATTISKARIAVSGPSTEPGAARKATIHGTSEEVGMALVVMGKRIAQQHVPNLRRKPKPKRPAADTTRRLPTAGRSAPSTSACQDAIRIAQAMWPAHDTPSADGHAAHRMRPPDGIPPYAPRPSPTPGAWEGEPAAHRRGAVPQQPAGTTAQTWPTGRTPPMTRTQAAEARCRLIARLEDEDDRAREATRRSGVDPGRSCGHASQEQGDDNDDDDQPHQTARWSGSGPSRGRGHPPSVTPISGPSQGTTTTTTNPAKLPDGAAAAPVVDVGMPPEQTPWIAPSPVTPRDEDGGIRRENS
jgi:hypothetical protein